jgi:proline iminopeptidase
VILLDQRGCGQSRPNASTVNNTTWHLVSDIEKLREHLGITKWHVVFGGSWGSTLALAYAQAHPSSVGSLVLRGIFAFRALELKWTNVYGGASFLFPDHYEDFVNFLPEEERKDHVASYHKRLMSEDESISHPAARAWNKWEISISTLYPNTKGLSQLDDASYNLAHARMEIHYFTNGGWLEDGQLLKKENIDKIRHIPSETSGSFLESSLLTKVQLPSCRAVMILSVHPSQLGSCTRLSLRPSCTLSQTPGTAQRYADHVVESRPDSILTPSRSQELRTS